MLDRPVKFLKGGGIQQSSEAVNLWAQALGSMQVHLLKDCPLAMSIGRQVRKGRTFVWEHGKVPYIALNHRKCCIWCPLENRWYASRVKNDVPMFSIGLDQAGNASIPVACETQHSETEPNGDALVLQQHNESVAKTCKSQHHDAEPYGDAHTLQMHDESVNKIATQAENIVGRFSVAACATHQCSTFCEECVERTYACVCLQFPSHCANPNGEGSVADRTLSACPAKGAEPNGEAPKRDS